MNLLQVTTIMVECIPKSTFGGETLKLVKLAIMDFESSDTLKFAHRSNFLLLLQDVGAMRTDGLHLKRQRSDDQEPTEPMGLCVIKDSLFIQRRHT